MTVILGIDPGYDRVGAACITRDEQTRKEIILHSECITTDKKETTDNRIATVCKRLEEIIKTYNPTHLAIETLFMQKNQKTVMAVSEARGAIKYLAYLHNLTIHEYNPLQIKIALTGYGKASKDQVLKMVEAITKKDLSKKIDDEVDAIAVAMTCNASLKTYS